MGIRLGINPLTWTIDDLPEVGGETPLETCLAEAKAAGFATPCAGDVRSAASKAGRSVSSPSIRRRCVPA